jgi:putative oxidoreductase
MNGNFSPLGMAVGRVLMALIFIQSGIAKLGAVEATRGYIESAHLPGILVWPTILFEIIAGILIVIGFKTRLVAILLAIYCLVSAAIFHSHLSDQMQLINFMKNVSMAGGFLLLACVGPGSLSVDGRGAERRSRFR